MKQRVRFIVALLLMAVQGVWAWEGSGTSTDPYLIQNLDEWKSLSYDLAHQKSHGGEFFRLTTDLDLEGISVGSETQPFSGTFDGDGHTLTYNRGGNLPGGFVLVDDYCAPFIRLDGATIRHLNVTGSIYSNHKFAAGIASIIDGSEQTTIMDCHVSSILFGGKGVEVDATFGGLVAVVKKECTAEPVITGCSFTGSITMYAAGSSGMVGYAHRSVKFENCLFDPKEYPYAPYVNTCATFARMTSGVECTFTDCYYTVLMGTQQGRGIFKEVIVPDDCKAEIISEPLIKLHGDKYYGSGTKVSLTVPEGTPFDHWVDNSGSFISDPWTANGVHTISDIHSAPTLGIATSMPEPVQSNRKRLGINYRYLSKRDYLLFMSDSLRQARNFRFDRDGECYVYDAEGTKNYVTVIWDCDPDAESFQNYYREGWFWKDKNYEGSVICNDLVATIWDHTMLFGIAPRAFQGVKSLKRIMFLSNEKVIGKSDCTAPLVINIQEQAFKDSGIEELVMVYRNEKTAHWDVLSPTSGVTIAANAFEGTDCRICVDPGVYASYMQDPSWADHYGRIGIYAAKVEDMKVNGAIYSYWRNGQGEPLKNNDAGHKSLMETLKYWNTDYQQFTSSSLLSNSSENIWYTRIVGADDDYLKSNNGVMRIYNDPGTQYNYKTITIEPNAFKNCKELKTIEFWQTNGYSSNSYSDLKLVIQNGAFAHCDSLKELRMYYYVQDGDNHWETLGPKDVIPGDNIFGTPTDKNIEKMTKEEYLASSVIPDDFHIVVSPERYQEFINDPNWVHYANRIVGADYEPTSWDPITEEGLSYDYASKSVNTASTNQIVTQNLSWWNLPVKIYEAITLYRLFSSLKEIADVAISLRNAYKQYAVACAQSEAMLTEQILKMQEAFDYTLDLTLTQTEKTKAFIEKSVDFFMKERADNWFEVGTEASKKLMEKNIIELPLNNRFIWTEGAKGLILNSPSAESQAIRELMAKEIRRWTLKFTQNGAIDGYRLSKQYYGELLTKSLKQVAVDWDWAAPYLFDDIFLSSANVVFQAVVGDMTNEQFQRGLVENIKANMHNVSYENSLIYTPDKKLIYHVYVDKVTDNSKDSITIYNDIGRAWNYRTVAIKKKAFQGNTKIKKIGFAENAVAGSDSYVPLQLAIPDSAFAGCTSLERFNLLFKTRKGGRRGLGPENFILGGDSIFAGCDSTKLQIVIASDRKQDFLDDEIWRNYKRFFVYEDVKEATEYTEYGVNYAYLYDRNTTQRVSKVNGHKIEHLTAVSADNKFLDEHQGSMGLFNDIGSFNNYKLDFINKKAFAGNDHVRTVSFWDLNGGDAYTQLGLQMGDSCFINCKNLKNIDMLYCVTDGDDHLETLRPEQVRPGKGMFDGSPDCVIKMLPSQQPWFEADTAWAAYKDRFLPCIIKTTDEGVWKALKKWSYYTPCCSPYYWEGYVDLARIAAAGFSCLKNTFSGFRNAIRSFTDFKQFEVVGLDSVGRSWFIGCSKLSSIALPKTIKAIHGYAFYGCSSLREIELPALVGSIDESAFENCTGLKRIIVRNKKPAKLEQKAFPKNDGMKIYVPAESLSDYLRDWAEYKDYIVSDDDLTFTKVVKVDQMGTLAEKLGLEVEWSYTGTVVAGDEPYWLHGNYARYDSLTVSGPINDLDLWVLRYMAGNNGYERGGGTPTDGKLRYLNLYNADIKKDKNCKANYLNMGEYYSIEWWDTPADNHVGKFLFRGCGVLETLILPKSVTTITSGIFEDCTNLRRLAITGATSEYDGWNYSTHMLEYPLEELVFLTDGLATSDAKDPWGQPISQVYTKSSQLNDYTNHPYLINQAKSVMSLFEDDAVIETLAAKGEFFPGIYTNREDIEGIFPHTRDLRRFKDFNVFTNVKSLGDESFRDCFNLEIISLPDSLKSISAGAFANCYSLDTIYVACDSVPKLAEDAFRSLPNDFRILVPKQLCKLYREKWAQYADHINADESYYASDDILTVTVTEPNTLAKALGLKTTEMYVSGIPGSPDRPSPLLKDYRAIIGVSGNYSRIRRLKVIGPISGADLSLLRYLAGYCAWNNSRNYLGHLEYIDLYDAHLKVSDYDVARDVATFTYRVDEENVLPAYSFLQCYNLKTLILPRTCKEVCRRALQQCEDLEILVIGDDCEVFNWDALDDDASLTRLYILSKKKLDISSEFFAWRWLCNNYNPTFDAFYVRPSLYNEYVGDNAYTGSSWQRTNNISHGAFADDDSFASFAAHAAATADDLRRVTSVDGWFDRYPGAKDLTALAYTSVDTLRKATLAPLTQLERIALPASLEYMEDGLLENANGLRYADFLQCDSTNLISKMGDFESLGINTEQTLVYVPKSYGDPFLPNVITDNGTTMHARTFNMIDSLNYLVPYEFETENVTNTRKLMASDAPYTVCLPYKLEVPDHSRAYALSERSGSTLVFKEVTGELEAMKPYLLKVNGIKRYNIDETTLKSEIAQKIPSSGGSTYGRQDDAAGYSLRGTFDGIDNATAHELGAYILQSDGEWHPVSSASESERKAEILPFRAYLLPNMHYAKASIGMTLEDTTGIDTIETIDKDGTEHYYDLDGRELPGKPAKGVYIYKGKKYVNK